MRFRAINWLAGVALASLSVAAQANLIVNGSFGTDATGWTLGGTGCTAGLFDGSGNPGGSILLNACGEADSNPSVAQTVSGLTIGATYTLQWDEKLHVDTLGGNGKSFGVFLDNEPNNPIALNEFLDTAWHTVTQTFVATSTTHTIIFAAEVDTRTPGATINSDVSYYLDNVSLTGNVPEPSVLLLGMAGAVPMLGFRLRRKQARPA